MEKTAGDDRAGRSSADREEKNPVVTFRQREFRGA